jgi:hypothetical protein
MARTDDVGTGITLSRLAWLAQRPGGAHALRTLQQELGAEYGPELRDAMQKAERRARRGRPAAVVFAPTMERAYRRMRTQGAKREIFPGYTADTLRFYRNQHWPFSVTSSPHQQRPTAVVIWDTEDGWNVHGWAETKRRTWRELEEARGERHRQRTMNDPTRRLHRGRRAG